MLRRTALAAGLTTCLAAALTVAPFGPAPGAGHGPDGHQRLHQQRARTRARPSRSRSATRSSSRPAPAAKHPVPLLMHSHGWGGSRTKDPAELQEFLDAGYGVLSFDQRGFGESGGQALRREPEGRGPRRPQPRRRSSASSTGCSRTARATRGWARSAAATAAATSSSAPSRSCASRASRSSTRSPPRSPGTTSADSLAPEGVVRTEWALALSAAAVPADALPHNIYKALVEGAATGTWPDGSVPGTENLDEFFKQNGPKWHVDHGRKLDIPVLFGQGTTDSLFNLQQGLTNWRTAITDRARKHSIFVGYNGGHVLPAVFPQGVDVTSDPCSEKLAGGDFRAAVDPVLRRAAQGQRHRAAAATASSTSPPPTAPARRSRSAAPDTDGRPRHGGQPGRGRRRRSPTRSRPGRSASPVRRTSPAKLTAHPGQPRLLRPRRRHLAGRRAPRAEQRDAAQRHRARRRRRRCASSCPAVAVDVPEGQSLYLLVSAVSDTFVGMSSRAPGVVLLDRDEGAPARRRLSVSLSAGLRSDASSPDSVGDGLRCRLRNGPWYRSTHRGSARDAPRRLGSAAWHVSRGASRRWSASGSCAGSVRWTSRRSTASPTGWSGRSCATGSTRSPGSARCARRPRSRS